MANIRQDDLILRMIETTFVNEIKAALKVPLMKQAEAMVDEAIDKATEGFKVKVASYYEQHDFRQTIEVLLKRVS